MKSRWMGLTAILIGMGSSAIMQTFISVSMPVIVNELGGMSLYNWVFGAYMLASTVTIPLFGKMADLIGRRTLYIFGLIVFAFGVLLSGLSINMPMLVASRAVMGIGAGVVVPTALAIIGDLFEEKDIARIFGMVGVTQIISYLVGPLLGGMMTDMFSWRWGFFMFLPLEAACGLLIFLGVPSAAALQARNNNTPRSIMQYLKKLDWIGAFIISGGLISLVLGFQLIGWKQYLSGIFLAVFSMVILWRGILWERKCHDPVMPMKLLKRPQLRSVVLLIFLLGIINSSSSTYISLYYQTVLKESATRAGIMLIPMLTAAGIASVACGKISKAIRQKFAILAWFLQGTAFLGIGFIGHLYKGAAVLFSIPIGFGLGLLLPMFLSSSQDMADASNRGASGGMVQLSRNLGGAMGVSMLGVWISGGIKIETGLVGIFICLALVAYTAFIFSCIVNKRNNYDNRIKEKEGHNDCMVE